MINNTDLTDLELSVCIGGALSNIAEFEWEDSNDEDILCFVETPIGEFRIEQDVYSNTDMKYELWIDYEKLSGLSNDPDNLKQLAFKIYKSRIARALGD